MNEKEVIKQILLGLLTELRNKSGATEVLLHKLKIDANFIADFNTRFDEELPHLRHMIAEQ